MITIFSNQVLITSCAGWVAAEIIKFLLCGIIDHQWDITRLWGDGGMPSAHSATVSALAISTGITCGFDSPLFAIAAIMAIVVMHDATGVRWETGKQAKILNEMVEWFNGLGNKLTFDEQLKEFVGHTPLQVLCGAILGIIVAFAMHYILW